MLRILLNFFLKDGRSRPGEDSDSAAEGETVEIATISARIRRNVVGRNGRELTDSRQQV